MRTLPPALLTLLVGAGMATAGIPTENEVTCPVGGEVFTTTGTMSCSTRGRTMSFRPLSTCDFVTRLPICPSNGLPLYRDFDEGEVAALTRLLNSADWDEMRALPPWQRAYAVARHLDEEGTDVAFGILLSAFWYDTEALLAEPALIDRMVAEFAAERDRAAPEDQPFLDAILAYALIAANRAGDAEPLLARVRAMPDLPDYLQSYVDAVSSCRGSMAAEECRPDAPFVPNQDNN